MATNGNGFSVDYGSKSGASGSPTEGLSGLASNRAAKTIINTEVEKQTQREIALLQQKIKALQEINRLGQESGTMSKEEFKRISSQIGLLKTEQQQYEKISKSRKVNLDSFLKQMNSTSKLMDKVEKNYNSITHKMIEADKSLSDTVQQLSFAGDDLRENCEDGANAIKEAADTAKNSVSNIGSALSQTMKSTSNTLKDLANMFNLQTLANSALEQSAQSKISIMNEINKQFGFTTDTSQFNQFKGSLSNTLNKMNSDLGALFNSSDLTKYMSSLSTYGVTNTDVAEQQMKSSILATKYLGTTDETMTMMYKYMKSSNDYSMLDNHNKTIVGLLKSQLGVSEKQLDALAQMALSDQDALAASGMDSETYQKYVQQYETAGTALTSILGEDRAKSIMGVISEFAQSSYMDTANLTRKYGTSASTIQNMIKNQGDVLGAIQLLAGSTWGTISSDNLINATLQQSLGQDTGATAALRGLDLGDFMDEYSSAEESIKSLSDNAVDQYIESVTQTTWLEKTFNKIDTFMTGIPWNTYIKLANGVLPLLMGAQFIEGISSLKNLRIIKNGISKLAGTESGTGLVASNGGLLLGAAAGAVITAAAVSALADYQNRQREDISSAGQSEAAYSLKGTSLEGNQAMIGAAGIQNVAESTNSSTVSSLGSMLGYSFSKLGTSNRSILNKKLTEWMYKDNVLNSSGKALQWALMLASIGDLSAFNSATGTNMTISDLKDLLTQGVITEDSVNNGAKSLLSAGWYPYINNNKGRMKSFKFDTSLDGYHKAGKNYVPKDNYHALLHKGEMVLTADQANKYRNLYGIGGVSDYPTYSSGKKHTGTDLAFGLNTQVGSAVPGTVEISTDLLGTNNYSNDGYRSYGRYIQIAGDDGMHYLYGHLNQRLVSAGQRVNAGDLIGLSGSTGNSSGPHLHFEVRRSSASGTDVDPSNYITSSIRNIGDTSGANFSLGMAPDGSEIPTSSSSSARIPVSAGKRLTAFSTLNDSQGGVGGAGEITSSLSSNTDRLIDVLHELQNGQDIDKEILNMYSRANTKSYLNN